MTRQVEISTLSAHHMAHGGVVAHTSSWTPAAYELEESSPPLDSHIGGLPEPPDGRRDQGDKVVCILMGLTAGNAAGYRGGVINTGIEDILVLPAVPVVPLLPGPALRDGFLHVLGLRIVVPEALRRPSGRLLRQRPSTWDRNINWVITFVDASWQATPLVVAGLSRADRGHHVPALAVTSGGRGVGSDEACSDKSSRG